MAAITQTMDRSTAPWWLVLIEGVAAIILGVLLITDPAETLLVLVTFLGIWWLVSGILDIVSIFLDRTSWGWKLFSGIIGIVAGILILRHPLIAAVTVPQVLVIILGILGVVMGVVGIISAFKGGGWGAAIYGVISILFGLVLLGNSFIAGVIALPFVLGIFALIGGGLGIWQSFRIKGLQKA